MGTLNLNHRPGFGPEPYMPVASLADTIDRRTYLFGSDHAKRAVIYCHLFRITPGSPCLTVRQSPYISYLVLPYTLAVSHDRRCDIQPVLIDQPYILRPIDIFIADIT